MLFGRASERARIERLLTDARQGNGGSLVLRGEPGVGKTALLRYAIDLAEAMTVVKAVGIESEVELEYSGLLELCQPILAGVDDLSEHQATALRSALGIAASGADRFSVGASTLSLLALVAESRPLLVVLDDAQWIDAASIDALTFAARRLVADAVAVVVAVRDDSSAFGSGFDVIPLEGLDPDSAGRLLEHVAGDAVPADVAERLVDATRGNPLGLVELPRLLSVEQLSGAERIAEPLPVGEDVERAYSAAAARLPDSAREALVLLALSDAGNLELMAEVLAGLGGLAALEPPEDAGLIDTLDDRFVFRHPLVRAAIVQGAAPSARRSAHRVLAGALTREGDEERRAWHLATAAVGFDPEAAEALALAAASARSRGGYEAASEAFERSAGLTGDASQRAQSLADAAEMAWAAGDSARTERLRSDALASSTDTALRGKLVQLRGRIELQTGTPQAARDRFVEAADTLEEEDAAAAAGALGLAVAACHHGGLMPEGLVLARRARTIAPRDGGPADQQAEYMLGRALRLAGYPEESAATLGPVLDRMLETDELALVDLGRASIAAASLERDRESRELAGTATRVARTQGPMALAQTLTLLAETCVRQGEWQRASAAANEGLVLARDLGQPNVAAYFFQSLIRVEGARGNDAVCRAYADEALPLIRESGLFIPLLLARCALALLDLGTGRLDDAAAALRELSQTIAERGMFGRDYHPDLDLVDALVRLGCAGEAQQALDAWLARGGNTGSRYFAALEARCRGLLAEDDAIDAHFGEALALHAEIVDPFGRARTQLCYGERLRRAGRRVDARLQLRSGLDGFERLEATAWIKRARRELRATGERLGRRAAATGDELTPQELQVALQVAEGKTNREVGAALFLSPKTVEFHLARVYRKLDLSSRAELIRRFAESGEPALVSP